MQTRRRGDKNITTYNKEYIDQWQDDVFAIPGQIDASKEFIKQNHEQLAILEPQLAQINVIVLPEQIKKFKTDIIPFQEELKKLNSELVKNEELLEPILQEISKLESVIELKECELEIAEVSQEQTKIQISLVYEEEKLNTLIKELDTINDDIASIKESIRSMNYQNLAHFVHHVVEHNDGHHGGHHGHHYSGYHSGYYLSNASDPNTQLRRHESRKTRANNQIEEQNQTITSLKNKIEANKKIIKKMESRITHLQSFDTSFYDLDNLSLTTALRKAENKKLPYEKIIKKLRKDISHNEKEEASLQTKITNVQTTLHEAQKIVTTLNLKISPKQDNQTALLEEKMELEQKIRDHNKNITAAETSIQALQSKYKELTSNQFLLNLTDPQKLLNELIQNIRLHFAKYEKEHPAHQNPLVRIFLADFEDKINFITYGQALSQNESDDTPIDIAQKKYYQLSGYLLHMFNTTIKVDKNFAVTLGNIFGDYSVDNDEAIAAYRALHLEDSTLEKITDDEITKYDSARKNMEKELKRLTTELEDVPKKYQPLVQKFITDGRKLLNRINEKKEMAVNSRDTQFEVKYHTLLLTKTTQVLRTPNDSALIKELKELAKHNEAGKPSRCKKILGAVLLFAGTATALASVILQLLTAGFSSPITIPTAVAGTSAAIAGGVLFFDGREKDIVKDNNNFIESAKVAGNIHSLWPAPSPAGENVQPQKDFNPEDYAPSAPSFG